MTVPWYRQVNGEQWKAFVATFLGWVLDGFDATILTDPIESGGHERFEVKAATGEMLEVDHNTTLAQAVPAHKGDGLVIHGQLYIDPGPRYGVHCTHAHTSSGCPNPGWIEYNNSYYE